MKYIDCVSPSKYLENQSSRYGFEKKDLLGSGSFGQVFKGFDYHNQQFVALKFIPQTTNMMDKLLQQELETLKRIPITSYDEYKFLIGYKDFYKTETHYVIVMELFENSIDLQSYMNRKGKLNEDHVFEIYYQIVRGIEALHTLNIAHRDIKPQNILIRHKPDLQIKIVDFGYARRFQDEAQFTMSKAGSPIYMSPQNLFQLGYNPFSNDVWSLGILLYQMMTGRFPWRAQTGKELDAQLIKYLAQEIGLQLRQLSMYARELVSDCLRIDEKERISIKDLRWKIAKIIDEAIKQSFNQNLILPKFPWFQLDQNKPKLVLLFLDQETLTNLASEECKPQGQAGQELDLILQLIEDIAELNQCLAEEVQDYLGIFGWVFLRIVKSTMSNSLRIDYLQPFWVFLSQLVSDLVKKLNYMDLPKYFDQFKILEDKYILAELDTKILWEKEPGFFKEMQELINNTQSLSPRIENSFNYLKHLLSQFSKND